jgi:flagellar motility protein MotE (MotC chaperone)
MPSYWLNRLAEKRSEIVADTLDGIRERSLAGYLSLPPEELELVVLEAVSARLSAFASGEMEPLQDFITDRGHALGAERAYQLNDVISLSLVIKDAIKDKLASMIEDPQERLQIFDHIERFNENVILAVSEAFSRGREQAIRAQEAGYLTVAEILKEEIETTERNIQHLESQIAQVRSDLKDMQDFREALLSRLMSVGIEPPSS